MKIKIKSKAFILNYMNSNNFIEDGFSRKTTGDNRVNITNDMLKLCGRTLDAKVDEYLGYDYQSIGEWYYEEWSWPKWAVEVVDED